MYNSDALRRILPFSLNAFHIIPMYSKFLLNRRFLLKEDRAFSLQNSLCLCKEFHR
ncbi:MAG: HNH endonuclease [Lachnospiraceae bacterium]|nr:HNH endonuclease [Lachnospiraceae bacterium]